jgi:hypothetical protein
MLFLKYLLMITGSGLLAGAIGILAYDLYLILGKRKEEGAFPFPRWREARKLAALAVLPLLAGMSIAVVPAGHAAVRVSQFSGASPVVLYPGVHLLLPLVQHIETYNIRDNVYSTTPTGADAFRVQTKEGLEVGLAISVRYRLDPTKLTYIYTNLPQPVEREMVPPVVGTVLREIAPNYAVREVFATKRDEIRRLASERITQKLGKDGIEVKEIMLRDTVTAAWPSAAFTWRTFSASASNSADLTSFCFTSNSTPSRSFSCSFKLVTEGDQDHIRRVAIADAERMKLEADVLKTSPLLIQKIIAEKLSDKVQIMMVPNDGKFFFANDVLKGLTPARDERDPR